MANTNMNKSWDLAQGAVTMSISGGGSLTMQNVLVEMPILADGSDFLLTKGYVGSARCLLYWASLTLMRAYVFDENLDWVEFEYDSTTGVTEETRHGTYSIA